ncbi:MAG: sugar transferase [Planctomycetes bacterium]|nr:sugar transferase [Planctomycetota bacterium]
MHAPMAAGVDAANVASSTFARLTQERHIPRRAQAGSFWQRLAHRVGRPFVGLRPGMWLALDITILTAGLTAAYRLFPPLDTLTTPHVALWEAAAIFSGLTAMTGLVFGLFERETLLSRSRIVTRMLLATAVVTALAYAVIYVLLYATLNRRTAGLAMAVFLVAGSGLRLCAWWAIRQMRRGLLIVGSRALYESFERAMDSGTLHGYRLLGYAFCGEPPQAPPADPHFRGTIAGEVLNLKNSDVSDIVVGEPAARDPRVMDWMVPCLQRGCRVTNEATFYEKATGQILVDEITPNWFLFADLKVHCDQHAALKRAVDVITATLGLVVTAPLWPLIALAVKLCDGGPVFYTQDRVGQNGQIFRLHKFRTMRPNAENGRSIWSSPNDPRVTGVGRVLRRTRLDELPQLWNVLRGQMSIVGPRPERPDIVRELCEKIPYYAERHLVKPGITGWAQISFRYGSSIEDAKRKLQFDLYYLKNMSLELDMMILLRTLGTFIRGAC